MISMMFIGSILPLSALLTTVPAESTVTPSQVPAPVYSQLVQAPPKQMIEVQTSNTIQQNTTDIIETERSITPPEYLKFEHIKAQTNLDAKVLTLALNAYNKAHKQGLVTNPYLTVIDYSLPSSQQRMWVIDVKRAAVDFHLHVAHGKNSGGLYATNFSNESGSKASSLGTFITSDTYHGSNGYSLNLKGLNKGLNDKAHARRVVIHGADYVSDSYLAKRGQLGRSWGCPALERSVNAKVINKIKGGSVVFSYHPQKHTALAA